MSTLPNLRQNTLQCMAGYESRRLELLKRYSEENSYRKDPMLGGAYEIAALALGQDVANANAGLRYGAEWFERPPLPDHIHNGESDFIAAKLTHAYHLFAPEGLLENSTLEKIKEFFLTRDFASIYQSENHALILHTTRCLMGQVYAKETFQAYGKTGAELAEIDSAWLKKFLHYRARCAWGEFDSTCYLGTSWECLTSLHDFAGDAELRQLTRMMMDLLLTDMSVDCLEGMYGGAHGRIYPPNAMDHSTEATYPMQYLYFGLGEPRGRNRSFMAATLTCEYRPHPLVVDIALNRTGPYENRERKQLHNVADVLPITPLEGSIRKYTYWTKDYVMGCIQYQDAYPASPGSEAEEKEALRQQRERILHVPVRKDNRKTASYAHHQQHEWDLSFPTRTDARLFTHHPGTSGQHNYWTGDWGCNCCHFFQNKTALLALYDICENQPNQIIHAYVPRAAFDEVVEESGIIFVRAGQAYGSLRLLSGYRWTTEGEWRDVEVISEGARHGVVCEAGTSEEFGDFDAFRQEIRANKIVFDGNKMELEYHSQRSGTLWMNAAGGRKLNGQEADLDYPTYGCPYLQSAWKSGRIEMTNGQEKLTLDFSPN